MRLLNLRFGRSILAPLVTLAAVSACMPGAASSKDEITAAFEEALQAGVEAGGGIEATEQVSQLIKPGDSADAWKTKLTAYGFETSEYGSPNSLGEPKIILASKDIGSLPGKREFRVIYGVRDGLVTKVWARSFVISY